MRCDAPDSLPVPLPSVSGRRTKIMIDGKQAKRKVVKKGITCTFVYFGDGSLAKEVNGKG